MFSHEDIDNVIYQCYHKRIFMITLITYRLNQVSERT